MRRWLPPSKKSTRRCTTITSDLYFNRTWLFLLSFPSFIKRTLAVGLKRLEMTNGQNEERTRTLEYVALYLWGIAWGSQSAGVGCSGCQFPRTKYIVFYKLLVNCKSRIRPDLRLTLRYLGNGACTNIEKPTLPTPRPSPKVGTKDTRSRASWTWDNLYK